MATLKELRAQAKVFGIKGYSRMRKADLEELVSKAQDTTAIMNAVKEIPQTATELQSLKETKSFEEFRTKQASNVALIMKCRTKEALIALLEPLDTMSMWASAEPAIIAICGETPGWMIGGRRNYASLIMQAREKARRL